jgi:hypothetical protein
MGLFKSLKKIFKKILPFLPVILLFMGPTLWGTKLFNFSKGASGFFKNNLFKALVWGYNIYSALNPPKPPTFSGAGDFSEEPVYSWQGGQVTAQSNIPVSVIYGEWWVTTPNIIDRELDSQPIIDPGTATLYMENKNMKFEVPRNLVHITTIEQGASSGLIIGFDEKSGRHVYAESNTFDTVGWQEFSEISLGLDELNPFEGASNLSPRRNLIDKWNRIKSQGSRISSSVHNKFVFTPDPEHILSFMNYAYASDILFRLDLNNKTVYLYRPFSVLMDEVTTKVFDYSNFALYTTPGTTWNIGFGLNGGTLDFGRNLNPDSNHTFLKAPTKNRCTNDDFNFHRSQFIHQYTDAQSNFQYINKYNTIDELRNETQSANDGGSNDLYYSRHTDLGLFHANKDQIKFLDAVIHYHKEFQEFSLQLLVDDKENAREFGRTRQALDGSRNLDYPGLPVSNSTRRYLIGLRKFKSSGAIQTDDSVHGTLTDAWDSNSEYKNAVTQREFYGLFGFFQNYNVSGSSGTNSTYLNPSDKQSEIFNLAYLSFPEILVSENSLITNPSPSRFAHTWYDRMPRIERLSSQPQIPNWNQTDENNHYLVNQSIGAIVSMIFQDGRNTGTSTEKWMPIHVSYSYFSCICEQSTDPNHRFDPFLVEIANFSSLVDKDISLVDTLGNAVSDNTLLANMRLQKTGNHGQPISDVQVFDNFQNMRNDIEKTRNIDSILVDGSTYLGESYYIGNDTRWPSSVRDTFTHPIRDEIDFDSMMDMYLYDYAGPDRFLNFDNNLSALDIIYVPEHQYHLVKIEDTWVPIRGWATPIKWRIMEQHLSVIPNNKIPGSQSGFATDSLITSLNTSLYTSLGYDLIFGSFSGPYESYDKLSTTDLPSGYVSDQDGQMPFGQPVIIHEKIYWFDSNSFYRNSTDDKLTSKIGVGFQGDAEVNFINVGFWGGNPIQLEKEHKTNMISQGYRLIGKNWIKRGEESASSRKIAPSIIPVLDFSRKTNVIYEPVLRNGTLEII